MIAQTVLKSHECLARIPKGHEWQGAIVGPRVGRFCEEIADERPMVSVQSADGARGALAFDDQTLDFVFLDDVSRYSDAILQLRIWRHRVKPGGWIGGFNYCDQYPGVKRAIEELIGAVETGSDWTWFARL